jgi:hypothetical protein
MDAKIGVAAAAAATIQRHGVILRAMKDASGPGEAVMENACTVGSRKRLRKITMWCLEF